MYDVHVHIISVIVGIYSESYAVLANIELTGLFTHGGEDTVEKKISLGTHSTCML